MNIPGIGKTALEAHPVRCVFLIALVVRVLLLPVGMHRPLGEALFFLDAGRNIAAGKGFCLSASLLHPPDGASPLVRQTLEHWQTMGGIWGVVPPEEPTAFLPPLYPLLLALLHLLFGSNLLLPRLVGIAMGAATAVLAYHLSSLIAGRRAGLIAGLLLAFHPVAAFHSVEISTHQLAALTLLLPMWHLARGRIDLRRSVMSGALIGVAFLARPTSWMLLPLVGAWILLKQRSARLVLGLLAGALLVSAPWVLRNTVSMGQPLFFTTNGGRNLWEFNNQKLAPEYSWSEPRASRWMYDPIRDKYREALKKQECMPFPSFSDEPEWQRDKVLTHRFLCFIQANPMVYIRLVGVRINQIFGIWPLHYGQAIRAAFSAYLLPFLVFGITGCWMGLQRGGLARVIALFVFAFLALHALTAAGLVYRGMISPLLAISASMALTTPRKAARA